MILQPARPSSKGLGSGTGRACLLLRESPKLSLLPDKPVPKPNQRIPVCVRFGFYEVGASREAYQLICPR
jgi:hypothetical protein